MEGGNSKKRTNVTCLFCTIGFVFHNVEQLQTHLACPTTGLGRQSGCSAVKGTAPAIQVKYATVLADRETVKAEKKKRDEHTAGIDKAAADQLRKEKIQKLSGGGGCQQRDIQSSFAAATVHAEEVMDAVGRWLFAAGVAPNAFDRPRR